MFSCGLLTKGLDNPDNVIVKFATVKRGKLFLYNPYLLVPSRIISGKFFHANGIGGYA